MTPHKTLKTTIKRQFKSVILLTYCSRIANVINVFDIREKNKLKKKE